MSILSAPYFHNEEAAYAFVEARLWPQGPVCPKCGVIGGHYRLKGKSTRPGVYKCKDCRKPFRVTVGTIFEASHIKLNVWLQAIFLIAASKKGMSSNQLHRSLGISLKSAWFMSHRIRAAMAELGGEPMGGEGQAIEADETYIGSKDGWKDRVRSGAHKHAIFSLVQRNGKVRSFHVPRVNARNLKPILRSQVAKESHLMTDEARVYGPLGRDFAKHSHVTHAAKEYARGPVTTNSVEGYFSILKRGLTGVYQHVSEQHLQRYVTEFDFRYNNRVALGVNDEQRADLLLKGAVGKRLTYETTAQ